MDFRADSDILHHVDTQFLSRGHAKANDSLLRGHGRGHVRGPRRTESRRHIDQDTAFRLRPELFQGDVAAEQGAQEVGFDHQDRVGERRLLESSEYPNAGIVDPP